jgi:signal transduction histidine kinase
MLRVAQDSRFRLLRFYAMATLPVLVAVLLALLLLQRAEEKFFATVQREQADFFAAAQAELARQNEEAARRSLLAVHETSHVNLTQLVANTMWTSDFAPLVAGAQRFAVERCRALPTTGDAAALARQRACFAELGRQIQSLPGFAALDRKAYAAMRESTVFKIKVFDLRGITVYSSEHAQIGEDAIDNAGWKAAAEGRPASELTHRDRFSAFERVVENRDLISTYVPVRAGANGEVVGVFELYSDVTPFLGQIKAAAQAFAENIAANEASHAQTARRNEQRVAESSRHLLLIVGGLLVLLYLTSLVIVRLGQRIIDRQRLAQEQAAAREQLWHREKMAALSTMAANVSHEVGNPLTVIACIAQMLPESKGAPDDPNANLSGKILEQTTRIARMMRRISDFAAARSESIEVVDVNPLLASVCEFQSFDRRYGRTSIQFVPGSGLVACALVPDHLNEAMMNLLQAGAERCASGGSERGLRVATRMRDGDVLIDVSCQLPATGEMLPIDPVEADPRFATVRRRVADMHGRIEIDARQISIVLPPSTAP